MNRCEEIHNAALECSRDTEICHQWSFIKGAEWADLHPDLLNILADRRFMIDKACGWLNKNIHYDENFDGDMEWYIPFNEKEEMIRELRKAMEE